ncbi:hypothetical protein BH11ACT3_BH11ACT3_17850 [soil metagenome]
MSDKEVNEELETQADQVDAVEESQQVDIDTRDPLAQVDRVVLSNYEYRRLN